MMAFISGIILFAAPVSSLFAKATEEKKGMMILPFGCAVSFVRVKGKGKKET